MFNISLFPNDNYLLVTIKGVITLDDSVYIMRSVVEHPEFSPEYDRVYDFEQAVLDWGVDDIQKLIDFIKLRFGNSHPDNKVVFINSDSTEQTLLSLYLSIAPQKLSRNFKLAKSLDEAIEWLRTE